MNHFQNYKKLMIGFLTVMFSTVACAEESTLIPDESKPLTIGVFFLLFGLTVLISFYAGRKNKSVKDFYTAGGTLTPRKNGLAIAGDYLSAAAFLGVSGLIAIYGLDGITYVVGFFISFIPILLLVAEPCRNLGKYTMGDILSYRNSFRVTKISTAASSILVSLFYMVPQIVGGAVIINALIGVQFEISVLAVGFSMLLYVMFGGMHATTAIQVLKAVLLISFCFLMVVLSWIPFGFNVGGFFSAVLNSQEIQNHVMYKLLSGAESLSPIEAGRKFMEPGLFLKNPLEQASLGLALILGTAAMPHILMRFFTVPTAESARKSALYAMVAIGFCHLLIIVIGFSAAMNVGPAAILNIDKGGNLAAPMLAQYLGGGADSFFGNLMLAFIASVAFATIVAVVAGLTLAAASSLAHDIYVGGIKRGQATESEQNRAAKIATIAITAVAIFAGIAAKGQNVAHLVGLGYAVAASANFPALIMTLYWKRCSTAGVIAAVIGGTLLSILMVLVSPNMTYPLQVKNAAQNNMIALEEKINELETYESQANKEELLALKEEMLAVQAIYEGIPANAKSIVGLSEPLINMRNPGIITIPIGFGLAILFSLLMPSSFSRSMWSELVLRRETGYTENQVANKNK